MKLLFVDDELNVLDGIRRNLRSMREIWEVDTACGGEEALSKMENSSFDIIISDMRMPRMSGIELLEIVRNKYPETIRFILSGQADHETALRSATTAHQFLAKPCDLAILKSAIDRALHLRDILASHELRSTLTRVRTIPSLPSLYYELVDEMNKLEPSLARIVTILEQDIGMTAKVLQMVNSAFFGSPRRVERVSDAASLLGLDILKALVTAVHIFDQFDSNACPWFDIDALMKHSLRTGQIARSIACYESMIKTDIAKAMIAGMLHDVGKIVFASSMTKAYESVHIQAQKTGDPIDIWEAKAFRSTHAELGGYILGLWGFHCDLIEAVVFHHRPQECKNAELGLVEIIHVAGRFESSDPDRGFEGVERINLEHFKAKGLAGKPENWYAECMSAISEGR